MAGVSVRYIVTDVESAIRFYVDLLGFEVVMHPAPQFAMLRYGDLVLLLNKPGIGGGGHAADDGRLPEPGGWNRFQLTVDDLKAMVTRLKAAGCRIRTDLITGQGGSQAVIEDPSGNPIELFRPA